MIFSKYVNASHLLLKNKSYRDQPNCDGYLQDSIMTQIYYFNKKSFFGVFLSRVKKINNLILVQKASGIFFRKIKWKGSFY